MNRSDAASPPPTPSLLRARASGNLPRVVKWLCFALFLLWGWRVPFWTHLPAYGDVLEIVWGIGWYDQMIFDLQRYTIYPDAFYPEGFSIATFPHGPALFLLLLPLYKLGGVTFAINSLLIAMLALSFHGMYRLTERSLGPWMALLAALMYAFWGMRWQGLNGAHNVMLMTSLLPWILWSLDRGLSAATGGWRWGLLSGLLWAVAISSTLYAIWMGALAVGVWGTLSLWKDDVHWKQAARVIMLSGITALLGSSPVLWLFLQARASSGASFYDAQHIDAWGASLNNLPIPNIFHPWFSAFSRRVYSAPIDEAGVANFGLAASLAAVAGAWRGWRNRTWRPFIGLTITGVILAMGLTLKWNHFPLQWPAVSGLTGALWEFSHALKPAIFLTETPPPHLASAVPLPGWILTAVVPFWEGARTTTRFAFLAGLGFFPLVAWGVAAIRSRPLLLLVALVLLLESLPPPQTGARYPVEPHPAFRWLSEQPLENGSVVDIRSLTPGTLELVNGGATALAGQFHGHPASTGPGSVLPAGTAELDVWLRTTPDAFSHPEFAPRLRSRQIRYVLVHMFSENEAALYPAVATNPALHDAGCFETQEGTSPWYYDICIVEVLPAVDEASLQRDAGWLAREQNVQ